MKTILNLIRIDLVALSGKKSGIFVAMLVLFVICAVYSFFLPAFVALYIPLFGALLISEITNRELKAEYGKTFCVVPADRKSVVLARFLLAASAVTALSLAVYFIMRILAFFNYNYAEELMEIFSIGISAVTLGNVFFSASFALGMMIMSGNLRKHFRYGAANKKRSLLRTVLKILLAYIVLMIIVSVLIYISDVPFVQTVFNLIVGILNALSRPAEGLLLSLTLIIIGFGAAAYNTVCAVIEYDEREL